MRIHVDPQRCQGHNRCVTVAASLVDIDDEGYAAEIGGGHVPGDALTVAELAVANCPEQAIVLIDDA